MEIVIALVMMIAALSFKDEKISRALFYGAYFVVGREVLITAFYNIKNKSFFNENLLMTIATFGALFLEEYSEAVFVMLFYKIGKLFESIAVGKSRKSIESLLEYAPEEARVLRNKEELVVYPDEVEVGEVLLVFAGEKVALDGLVLEGESSLNMAFLTGESLPVDVKPGDEIKSGSINNSGVLKIKVTREFSDSTVSKILELIEESSSKKSVLESFISRFAKYYTPAVVISAILLAFLPPLILAQPLSTWIRRGLIFLVVSCPCALVISVPLSFFGGIGQASKQGILVKGSNYLEALSMVDQVVFDKTGTLTEGSFEIIREISYSDLNFRSLAGSIEAYSKHPIAESIAKKFGSSLKEQITDVKEIYGKGLVGQYQGRLVGAGNERLLVDLGLEVKEIDEVGTKVYVVLDQKIIGVLVIADVIKKDTKEGLSLLRKAGIKSLVLLTGDKKEVANKVGKSLGIDKIYSELLPEDKVKIFEEILEKKDDKKMLAFVGDGINDAPVLTRADLGIAMGALGSDAAIEAADVVLMDDKISKLSTAIKISKKTMQIARENIIFALGVKFLVLFFSIFGLTTMWMAIFADVGVMVIAIINSMRMIK